MKKALNSMAILVLLGMSSSAFADCYLDKSTSGWTGSLQFHCDSATDLEANSITFDVSNNIKVSSIWGLPGNAVYTQDGSKVSVTVKKWWPDEAYVLPANSQATLQFSPSSNDFQISNFHVGTLKPQSKATIIVSLPQKPSYIKDDVLADVIIYKADAKVYELNKAQWGQQVSIPVTFSGDSAQYSVTVPDLEGGQGAANPQSFSLSNGGTQSVDISYQAPKPVLKGNISITASTPGAADHQPGFSLKNSDGVVVDEGQLQFDHAVVIKDLPTTEQGERYYLSAQSYADDGFIYEPSEIAPVTVKNGQTSQVQVSYTKKVMPSESITISVSGLPAETQASLTVENSENKKLSITLDGNKSYSLQIPQDGLNWTAVASTISGYNVNVTPDQFKAEDSNITLNIQYSKKPDVIAATYFSLWGGNTSAARHGERNARSSRPG